MTKRLLFCFLILTCFSYPVNFITIQSKETAKSAEKKILSELKDAKFKNIKILHYKDQEFTVILFEDEDFLKMAKGNHPLLISIPFRVIISSRQPSRKNANQSLVSYQDFEELKRYNNSNFLDSFAKKMVSVIKKSKI